LSRVVASAAPAAVTRLGTAEGLTGSPPSAGRPCATQGPQTRASTPPTAGPLPPVRCGPPQRGAASPAPRCARCSCRTVLGLLDPLRGVLLQHRLTSGLDHGAEPVHERAEDLPRTVVPVARQIAGVR